VLQLLLALSLAAPKPPVSLEDQRAGVAKEILALAGKIQREIEAGDVAALVARVPPEGLRCAGQVVPRARVERDLRAEGSWLHGVFFGGPGAAAQEGQPASLKALFSSAKEIAVLVAFREDPRSPVGIPCADFHAKDTVTPGAPLCFERRGGKWWFTESLYPC
jgi:hypothetical protein